MMKKILPLLFIIILLSSLPIFGNVLPEQNSPQITQIIKQTQDLDPKILALGLRALRRAQENNLTRSDILTIIDYSLPSDKNRLWVINTKENKVLDNIHVAHGKDSGSLYAQHFSDNPQSYETSIGVFLTGNAYIGKHGFSLRLHGLDKGFNDEAYQRDIVIHQAWYVTGSFLRTHGYIGRSWGCPALSPQAAKKIIGMIKDGTIVLAYYPNQKWLRTSHFVKDN